MLLLLVGSRLTQSSDNGSDEYDTSEKARIPAWTDRILYKGTVSGHGMAIVVLLAGALIHD